MKTCSRNGLAASAARAALAAAILTVAGGETFAADFTLKIHHFLSPRSNDHTRHLVPWGKAVEAASGGRIAVQVFPAMQLGGKAPNLAKQVEDGVVDVGYTLPGYTPNKFKGSAGLELPFIGHGSEVMSQVAMAFYDMHLRDEYARYHVISIHSTDPATIHTPKRPVRRMEDFKGLKVRVPSRYVGMAARLLGAVPGGLPLPQVYEALSRGQFNALMINWGVMTPFKLHEVTRYHTDVPVYNTMLATLMNRKSLDRLPADLRKHILDRSGFDYAHSLGRIWDEANRKSKDAALARGNEIIRIGDAELARWKKQVEPAIQAWAEEMSSLGKDGPKMLADLRALADKYRK